ncbi:peptide/nickel transport system permease protein [Arboricoccus pini]|uniref:Peptide/nickel transport system permease protein n=1 Tax=Arboricoccus pini TaxID=1963835 RepID=A0A212R960_9PROT|nr:ABC transporter permease [Arboricoccus pini]SNB68663.1 peptide/nickel transport system permease protein [Arboricoccus pini]
MLLFVGRKLAQTIFILLMVSIVSFTLLKLAPGDPVQMALGSEYSQEAYASLTHEMGLDQSLVVQYGHWLWGFITGDWGRSYVGRTPIFQYAFVEALPVTLTLAASALFLAILIGVPLGVLSAARQDTILDAGTAALSLTGTAFPSFYLGILLIWIFGVHFGLFPTMGFVAPWQDFLDGVYHMTLPALTLSTYFMAMIVRLVRANLIEALQQPYVAAARARGESERRVIWLHGMRNVLMPLVTVLGLQLGALLQGAVLTETVFSLPGVGQMITNAVLNREYLVVQAGVMMTGCLFIFVNLLVDLAYPWLDPRLKPR